MNAKVSIKYGSVCSGIEAATAAWHPLGWKPSFFSEIDSFPRAVLEHHYPDVPLHGDFTTIQDGDYEPIDLLVGGTPCQSFSVAGLRNGLDDPRGSLMLGFGALAKRLRPTWLVWENVPGVLSASGGRDFGTFLGMLGELGYGFAYRVLDAQYFGVAQRRRRVFVVGYLGDWRPPAAVLFERHSLSGHPAPSREAREEIAVAPTVRAGGNSTGGDRPYGTDVDTCDSLQPVPILEPGARTGKSTTDPRAGSGIGRSGDPMLTLQAGKQHGVMAYGQSRQSGPVEVSHALSAHAGRLDFESETFLVQSIHGTQDPIVSDRAHALGRNSGQENAICVTGSVAHTLRGEGFDASEDGTGRGTPVVGFHTTGAGFWKEGAGTLRARPQDSHENLVATMAVRRLTPVECERLQGFPDNFTLIPTGKMRQIEADYLAYLLRHCPGLSEEEAARLSKDGPRYKAIGNSMAVPVMEWLGKRIEEVTALCRSIHGADALQPKVAGGVE